MVPPKCSAARRRVLCSLVGLAPLALAGSAAAAVVPAELVTGAGDVPLGASLPVAALRSPFALADGTVAFVGLLDDGDAFVFVGDQVVWQGSDEMMVVLATTETTMGGAVGGAFVYSPTVDGNDAIWTHLGLLAVEGEPAPVFPEGVTTTFHSRPTMAPSGTPYWVAGINITGGASTEGRVLYRSPTALPGDIEVLMATGDMLGGLTIDVPDGIDIDYDVSSSENHSIHVLLMDTGTTLNDGHIAVDGALLHQEDTPNGTGDDWDNFDLVTINDQGMYVVTGDTNGATGTDEFIAIDGVIEIREGDVIAGITLTSTAVVRLVSIDDAGRVAHAWSYGAAGTETVFYACDPDDVAGSSLVVLTTGVDELDLDGDGLGDALVTNLGANTSSSTEALTNDEALYLELEFDDGTGPREAVVRVPVSCCGNMVLDDGELCDDGNGDDSDACPGNCMPATCGDGFTWAGMEECDDGNPANTDACLSTCVAATCGDGALWAGVEVCDDGNGDDSDQCPGSCMLAVCGDGYVRAGVEACDDGNADDTDACLSSCVAATCGDGIVWVGTETCDDANQDDTDACPGTCQEATCGDGFVWAGVEECDDGNDDDTDGCTSACTTAEIGGSSGGESSSGGDDTGDPPGTTGGQSSTGPGSLDDSGGADTSTGAPPPIGSTGAEGSTGETEGTPLGGLDDDGGCTCRAAPTGPRGGLRPALGLLGLLGLGRRRRVLPRRAR